MFSLTIPADTLKALAIFAPESDVRYYLNGLCVDLTTAGRVHLVATGGHCMLIVGGNADNTKPEGVTLEGDAPAGRFIVPLDAFKAVKPMGKHIPLALTIEPDKIGPDYGGTWSMRGKVTTTGRLIEGKFPEWQRVVPRVPEKELQPIIGQFNLEYLGQFGKAASLLGCRHPALAHNGPDKSAIVHMGASAFGIIMPMRVDTPTIGDLPAWLDATR